MERIAFALAILLFFGCNTSPKKTTDNLVRFSTTGKKVTVFTTADTSNYRLQITDTISFTDLAQPLENQICVFIDPTKTFQTYLGIGGAITDAAAETFYKLTPENQQKILEAYYDKKTGIGYTVARTNMNSCDFSSDMYTYVKEMDSSLNSFSIAHDTKYKIPLIKEAIQKAGSNFYLFASPWSPPAWMKSNKDMLHGGKLLPQFNASWAQYYVKFIKAYQTAGVNIWGLSIQNEPMSPQKWESCVFTAQEEADFLKNHLGPTLEKEGLKDKKIIVWDHNRNLMYQRAQVYFKDPNVAKYIWGIGYHWYDEWMNTHGLYNNLKQVQEAYPSTNLFFTEGCNDQFDAKRYNDWSLGERYGRNMIQDFNNGMVGFTDWNILLDETGGPNHVGNFCFAPIHANTKTNELIFTNSYYYIGHFSKFLQPNAKRISCSLSTDALLATAFINPDNTIVVIVMNDTNKTVPYFLWIDGKAVAVQAKAHSIATLKF